MFARNFTKCSPRIIFFKVSDFFSFLLINSSSVATMTTTVATIVSPPPPPSSGAVRRRSSEERSPGEPGTSTDGGRPRSADAAATAHGRRAQHCRNGRRPRDQQRLSQHEAATSSPPGAMITVGACGSRPKTRARHYRPQPTSAPAPSASSAATFPVDVADRLRSPVTSPARPRQYGRRRSVQDAAVDTAAQAQRQRLQVAVISAFDEPDAITASDDDRQQEQEPPRLVTPLRSVSIRNDKYLISPCYDLIYANAYCNNYNTCLCTSQYVLLATY